MDERVYLFRWNDAYKIGRSRNVNQRVKQLGLPSPPEIVHTIETSNAPWAEAYLHARFAEQRIGGEWFRLAPSDVEYICGLKTLEPLQSDLEEMIVKPFNLRVPESLHARLVELANHDQRSLNAEIIYLLRTAAEQRREQLARRASILAELRTAQMDKRADLMAELRRLAEE